MWRSKRRVSQLDLASQAGVSPRHLVRRDRPIEAEPRDGPAPGRASRRAAPRPQRDARPRPGSRRCTGSRRSTPRSWRACVRRSRSSSPTTSRARPSSSTAPGTSSRRTRASTAFLDLIAPELLEPPMNVIRASLHPRGLSPVDRELRRVRRPRVERLNRQLATTADPGLDALLDEVMAYPGRRATRSVTARCSRRRRRCSRCTSGSTTAPSCASSPR